MVLLVSNPNPSNTLFFDKQLCMYVACGGVYVGGCIVYGGVGDVYMLAAVSWRWGSVGNFGRAGFLLKYGL